MSLLSRRFSHESHEKYRFTSAQKLFVAQEARQHFCTCRESGRRWSSKESKIHHTFMATSL